MTAAPTPINWLSIAALGVIWGATFMVVRIALDEFGPLTVACARTTLGALALFAVAVALRRPLPQPSPPLVKSLVLIGIFSTAAPFALLSWGQQYVPSAFAGISMSALPLFLLPLAHVFSDEKMSARKTSGVIIGFLGTLVLVGPSVLQIGTGLVPLGQLACLAAALCYAISSILTRRCPPIDPLVLGATTLLVGAACLIPAMLLVEGLPQWKPTVSGVAIVVLGLVPTALATLLRVLVIRSAGSVFMSLVNYQVPLWSVIFGALILSEALPLRFFAALALILTGLAVGQWPQLRKIWRQNAVPKI